MDKGVVMKKIVEFNGKLYEEIDDNTIIMDGAIHTFGNGGFNHIVSPDTVGDTPSSFSRYRKFYNPLGRKYFKSVKGQYYVKVFEDVPIPENAIYIWAGGVVPLECKIRTACGKLANGRTVEQLKTEVNWNERKEVYEPV